MHDENGKLSETARYKILESFGYGGWERSQNLKALHLTRAEKENLSLSGDTEVSEVDDHDLHVEEHVKYFLSSEFSDKVKKNPSLKETLLAHIRKHKTYAKLESEMKGEQL